MFNRVEPVFVIIDDYSAFGSNYGLDYTSGQVNHDGKSVDVCLFDYGFIDFIDATGPTIGAAKYHNISNFDQAVLDEITYQWGSQVSAFANVGPGLNTDDSTWLDDGTISTKMVTSRACGYLHLLQTIWYLRMGKLTRSHILHQCTVILY